MSSRDKNILKSSGTRRITIKNTEDPNYDEVLGKLVSLLICDTKNILSYNFQYVEKSVINHITMIISLYYTVPIEIEIDVINFQLFKGQKYPLSIFSSEMQKLLHYLKCNMLMYFGRISKMNSASDFKYNDDIESRIFKFRQHLIKTLFIFLQTDSKLLYRGKYEEIVRKICLASLKNLKVKEWKNSLDEFFIELETQIKNF